MTSTCAGVSLAVQCNARTTMGFSQHLVWKRREVTVERLETMGGRVVFATST